MPPEEFFELLLVELKDQPDMWGYYKFLQDGASFEFRKAYFLERLRYVWNHFKELPTDTRTWDCGCGYGTTALFLAMNGYAVHGTTLEFYYAFIAGRKAYWSRYGNAELFTCSYENVFDSPPAPGSYDRVIVQDTLHHIEPIAEGIGILYTALSPAGQLVVVEENGSNLVQRAKLYRQRGSRRIITQWDEELQKEILIGNENIRSLEAWQRLLTAGGFRLLPGSVSYVRYYFPQWYKGRNAEGVLEKERVLQQHSKIRRKYFFFGLNFRVGKEL